VIWDFLKENWLFIVIVLGTLALVTLAYMIYVLDNRRRLRKMESQFPKEPDVPQKIISLQDLIDQDVIDSQDRKFVEPEKKPQPLADLGIFSSKIIDPDTYSDKSVSVDESMDEIRNDIIPKEILPDEDPIPDVIEEKKPAMPPKKPAVKKQNDVAKSIPKKKTETVKKDLGRYHVLYREDDDMWYVKREGSDRTLRILPTQREAIAYATIKAITQDTGFIVHNKDGKIRK